MPYGYCGLGKDCLQVGTPIILIILADILGFLGWGHGILQECLKIILKRSRSVSPSYDIRHTHTSLEGLDTCEMLTRNDIKTDSSQPPPWHRGLVYT